MTEKRPLSRQPHLKDMNTEDMVTLPGTPVKKDDEKF